MEMKAQKMNVCNMVYATERAKSRIKSIRDQYDQVTKDPKKDERIAACECIACFYSYGIGGAAITNRPCMSCGVNQLYGSTNTDVLCLDCANTHDLCKHCGGDLEMRVRRKEWPKPLVSSD